MTSTMAISINVKPFCLRMSLSFGCNEYCSLRRIPQEPCETTVSETGGTMTKAAASRCLVCK